MSNQQTALLIPEPQTAIQPITPLSMIQLALQQNASVEVLRDLFKLKQEVEADEARKAFSAAMTAFKRNPPRLTKNKEVDFTGKTGIRTHYRHATLDYISDEVGKSLSEHGLSFRWQVEQTPRIKVTCILQHVLGHSESVALEAPPDDSGNKNPIQQVGSTVTYLQRYTLLAITGMATGEQDTVGRAPQQKNGLTDEQFAPHQEAIQSARDFNELKAAFKRAYTMAVTVEDQKAFTSLYEARKKAMQ